MVFHELENVLSSLTADLKPANEMPADTLLLEETTFDRSEQDNSKWRKLISVYLDTAKRFEIHCWNEETEWIELALQYGTRKEDSWQYGTVITGIVTPQFSDMLLRQPKPTDTAIENKMTPFFNIFLDDTFQSCHYGTENYHT